MYESMCAQAVDEDNGLTSSLLCNEFADPAEKPREDVAQLLIGC